MIEHFKKGVSLTGHSVSQKVERLSRGWHSCSPFVSCSGHFSPWYFERAYIGINISYVLRVSYCVFSLSLVATRSLALGMQLFRRSCTRAVCAHLRAFEMHLPKYFAIRISHLKIYLDGIPPAGRDVDRAANDRACVLQRG